MADKMRVHILAKELRVPSKTIVTKCQAEGLDVKNHMSTLGPGLEATIREWFSEGAHTTVVETTERIDLAKAHEAAKPRKSRSRSTAKADEHDGESDEDESTAVAVETPEETPESTPIAVEEPQETVAEPEPEKEAAEVVEPVEPVTPAEPVEPAKTEPEPVVEMPAEPLVVVEEEIPATPAEEETSAAETTEPDQADASKAAAEVTPETPDTEEPEEEIKPAGPQHVPIPAKLSGPRVVRYEAPEEYRIPRRGRRSGPDSGPSYSTNPGEGMMQGPMPPPSSAGKGRGRGKPAADGKTERGGRRGSRNARDAGEKMAEWKDRDLAERQQRLRGATGRRMQSRRARDRGTGGRGGAPVQRVTEAQVTEPIILRQYCSALGIPFQEIFPVLQREHGLLLTINGIIPKDVAELVAAHFGVELTVQEAKTRLDELKDEFANMERSNLKRRPPIVAMLGHVDHGKTSLLDAIRRSRVANKEDGGITQHISSCHFKSGDTEVTFLDTPGHAAFTALRARGAKITDVVVLVIAADDGVMPQTIEAINHAKAAEVPIVVALNKIDLGTQNVNKIYGQLAEHGLTPSGDWGGEIDVIKTSATTGEGVNELLEHLSDMAEVYEFKADPTLRASGTVVEAESRPGVGAALQVIVREGTLHVGDVVVCGHSFGKVRAIPNDQGVQVREAGPSMPVEVWGLNEVAEAGDNFYVVDNMQRAKEIADEVKELRLSNARSSSRKARSLDDLVKHQSNADVTELNIIIRADVDGSIEALKSSLSKFPDDEVRLNILHAGVGAVTDSDIHLATASDAIVIAFRVTTPNTTRKLAEHEGVEIRQYRVIYDLVDEIKKALEGLLAPDEVFETRGTAEVREVFRITKLGLVAGCFVRDGVMSQNHFARVVRDGVVVREKSNFDSLRRFKDTVKEVKSGFECGIRLEGFDDIKAGDVIESYEVVKIARTLDQ